MLEFQPGILLIFLENKNKTYYCAECWVSDGKGWTWQRGIYGSWKPTGILFNFVFAYKINFNWHNKNGWSLNVICDKCRFVYIFIWRPSNSKVWKDAWIEFTVRTDLNLNLFCFNNRKFYKVTWEVRVFKSFEPSCWINTRKKEVGRKEMLSQWLILDFFLLQAQRGARNPLSKQQVQTQAKVRGIHWEGN